MADILTAVKDGLRGIGETLGAVFPATTLQTCIVHLIRNSLDYASWKDRRLLAAALKPVYTASSAEAAVEIYYQVYAGRQHVKQPDLDVKLLFRSGFNIQRPSLGSGGNVDFFYTSRGERGYLVDLYRWPKICLLVRHHP